MAIATSTLDLVETKTQPAEKSDQLSMTGKYLVDYGERIKNDYPRVLFFCNYMGVTVKTSERWFKGIAAPLGETELRARIALEILGYKFIEHQYMSQALHKLAQCIGLGLSSYDDVIALLDTTKGYLLTLLSGRNNTSQDKLDLIELYCEEKKSALDEAIEKFPLREGFDTNKPVVVEPVATQTPLVLNGELSLDKKFMIGTAIHLIRALTPVASYLVSEECSPDDRERVRSELGRFGVFNLKNDLVKLCGERARAIQVEG